MISKLLAPALAAFIVLAMGTSFVAADPAESDYLSRVRQLTFEGRRAGEGYFHPDGTKLIFQSERDPANPFYQIYILDLTTGESHRVSPGTGKTTCGFFRPGGPKVLFASTHLDPNSEQLQIEELELRASGRQRRYSWDYDKNFDIFEANQDGSQSKRLTAAVGYDAEASYSPDGTKIAFTSIRPAYPLDKLSDREQRLAEVDLAYFAEIYIMNADGSGQRRLTTTPGYDGGPFFTPDGGRIVWRRFTEDGLRADIYTMALDGSDVRRLTDFGAMSWAPIFHPSGDYAIFASNKLGFENFELFLVDAMGDKEPVRVTFTEGFDGLPVFSPDGERLCWTSTRYKTGSGREGGHLYLGRWNDEAARAALAMAPARNAASAGGPTSRPAAGPPSTAGLDPRPRPSAPSNPLDPAITESDLEAHVAYLASEELEGRLTGTEGERLAADYIARRFAQIGLKPLDVSSGYLSTFDFTAAVHAGADNALSVWSVEANPHVPLEERARAAQLTREFESGDGFLPLPISSEGEVEGVLAFAGYGLVVPGESGEPIYDSYRDLDVEGRVVLALRYVPEDIEQEQRQIYNRYAGLRYKALQARERGAVGLVVVSGPNSPTAGRLVSLGLDFGGASSGIRAASVDLETAGRLLATSEKNLEELQSALDEGEEIPGFVLHDTLVRMTVDLDVETRTGHNVIGVLEPSGGLTDETEYVVIGAHYDHLGEGQGGNSLARKGEQGQAHPGADDNASGTGVLMEIAEHMAGADRNRAVVFAAWSGEELGLLGSGKFVNSPPIAIERIVAYLNMDMVGRVKDNTLLIQGVGSSGDWRPMIERKNVVAGFSLKLNDDPYLPTDVMSFYLKKIPSLHFFSGVHEDYHRPTDTPDLINYEDMVRVAELVERIAEDLADGSDRPAYAEVERKGGAEAGGRESLRAYLGTIPDYATEIEGVKLSGVRQGGPADKAGLLAGDVIVEFAGQKIANIYDYTYALDAVKIGVDVNVVVTREGQSLTIVVTPEARQ